jgi:hypothetical protein
MSLGALLTALASTGCGPPPPPQFAFRATFVSGGGPDSVVIVAGAPREKVGARTYRTYLYLRRHSLDDGALLGSREAGYADADNLEQYGGCEPALPGSMWCVNVARASGLSLVDTASLQTVAVQSQMLGSVGEVAGTQPFYSIRLDPKTRGFVFEGRDGYAWILDPTTRAPSRFAGSLASIPFRADVSGPYQFASAARGPLLLERPYRPDELRAPLPQIPNVHFMNLEALHPEHTYLHGKILARLDNPARLLIVEQVLPQGSTLWCVSTDGATAWKVDLPSMAFAAKLHGDTLVIVTRAGLVAVRMADGAPAWTAPP